MRNGSLSRAEENKIWQHAVHLLVGCFQILACNLDLGIDDHLKLHTSGLTLATVSVHYNAVE